MKKLFCLIMSIALATSLTACGKETPISNSTSEPTGLSESQSSTQPESEPAELSQYEINFPSYDEIKEQYPDKTVLVWTLPESGYERHSPFHTREINEYLDENGCDYAVCFKPLTDEHSLFPDGFVAAVTEQIDNGEQIDIISPLNYDQYVFNGLFIPLDDYLKTGRGKEMYDLVPEKLWDALRINGSIYGINLKASNTLSIDWVYYVNAELAQKYGYNITNPILDQLDVLKAVKENEKNVDVFSTYLRIEDIIECVDVKSVAGGVYWNEETHSAECIFDDPQYIEKLRFYETLKNSGLLNDMGKMNNSDTFFIFQDNKPGSSAYDPAVTVKILYDEKNIVEAIPVFDGLTATRSGCPIATGICSSSENKEKAFELMSLVYTDPDLNNLMAYGIEGENFTLTNGFVHEITGDGFNFNMNPLNAYRFANDFIGYRIDGYRNEASPFTAEQYRELYENAPIHEDADFAFDGRSVADEVRATWEIMSDFKLPSKGDDNDKTLDEVIAETREKLEQAGIQKIIDEGNRQYEAYKNENN